jgi:hypothetical protein
MFSTTDLMPGRDSGWDHGVDLIHAGKPRSQAREADWRVHAAGCHR